MDKIIHLDPYFPTGELTIQPAVLWANGRACYPGISKHASVGTDYFKMVKPEPGHTFVYVLALGAWETYGENRNGDAFPEFPYMEHMSPPVIAPDEVLPMHYKSFETHGHMFKHHANDSPEKKIGDVVKAFWNPQMHRVELLLKMINAKAPELVERIADGDFFPVSMGTRVKFDICSIPGCHNRAPTRAAYCNHLKFQMRDVINGQKVCALNPSPKFFDLSAVFRGADKTAYAMKKVAEPAYNLISGAAAGEYLDHMRRQKIAARKMADMDKVVQGLPVASHDDSFTPVELGNMQKMRGMVLDAGRNTPDFPDEMLRQFAQYPLPRVVSSLHAAGMIQLSTPEVTKIIMFKSYPNKAVPEDMLSKSVAMQQGVFGLFEDFPNLLDKLRETGALDIGPQHVDKDIVKAAMPWLEKRSGIPEYLKRRFIPEKYRANETPYTTMMSVTDPATGQQYRTTRGAAVRAHDEIAKRNLYKIVGGGTLLAGGYHLMSRAIPQQAAAWGKPALMAGLGAFGASHLPSMGSHYMTDQGVPIPTMTELQKASADASLMLPALGTLGTMAALGHDYQSRMRTGVPLGYEGLPLSRRILDSVTGFAHEHPLITGTAGLVGLHGLNQTALAKALRARSSKLFAPVTETAGGLKDYAGKVLKDVTSGVKVSSFLKQAAAESYDTVLLPELNLDKIAEFIGWLIVES